MAHTAQSVSAFAPIAHPSACPWGIKAFSGYLGEDRSAWAAYDATELVRAYQGPDLHLLVDQGLADPFLEKGQLLPGDLVAACKQAGVALEYREQADYDHGYYFIMTFVRDHIVHHARFLQA